ncbi:DoxX family protein [Noviherbaspirillum galbum]|uniref:DoxX family protein n=1 Tax=Noviherbaspirillum galbum TaxID=2709383 RepID=A0A6B3SRL0_9BURK|nr:DoxX family protein [Noviherbaspirillum galbum]NEX61975.1 DoxX family protein [Noviherbaspirillum galbum]
MRNVNSDRGGSALEDLGKLILRATIAVLILFHGVAKIMGGPDFIVGIVGKAGLPPALGYLVYVGEVLAPLLMLIGIMTRPAALVIAINMVVAVALVHMNDLMSISKTGGWALELQGLYLAGALAVACLGAGRFSAGGTAGRWN